MSIRNLLVLVTIYILSCNSVLAQGNYSLINDATAIPGCHCYQLTPDQGNMGGGVYQNNTINLNNSFDYTFNIYLGNNGSSGADGMCFILTNNITAIGAQGGGLGYNGLPGNSLAVEYDSYQNGWDPDDHHMAIEYGGNVQHPTGQIAPPPPSAPVSINGGPIADGLWHTTEITWNVNTQTYSAYWDGALIVTYTGNIVANFFAGNPIVNWGWSGSTGGSENTQQFCVLSTSNWVAGTNYQSCNTTMQFTDISTTNVATVQSWAWTFGDPGSGGNNTSSLQNPTHTFTSAGTYTVQLIITDISGCPDTFSHIVTIAPPITLTPTITDPLCNGASTGSISLATSGGFGASAGYGGYAYTWSNGITVSSESGVTAGTYNVSVTDGVCSTSATYTLTQPTGLTASTSSTDANCGASNGSVSIVISGGTPYATGTPYHAVPPATGTVTWDGVNSTYAGGAYTRTGLPAGTYVANFQDANGCSALLTYRATVASLPCGYTASASSTSPTCFGLTNGSVTLVVTGSAGNVTINWYNSGGTLVGSGASIAGLPADTYTYDYSDNRPTSFSGTVVVNPPGGAMTVGLTTASTSCSYLNNGSAVASITANGISPFSYAWSASGQPNSPTATGLSPGPVSVTVTDNNNCTASASGTVSGQTVLTSSVVGIADSCYQTNTGKVYANVAGGTPGYTYLWSSGSTAVGDTVYSLAAGPYTVTVTDHNGCTATATGSVSQPPLLTATMTDSNVACFGASSGTATVTPSGGNGGFTYSWAGSTSTTATASGLAPNTYYVTVTDSKRCTVVDSAIITQPQSALSVTEDSVNVKCTGQATGVIILTAIGGSLPNQNVTWSDGGSNSLLRTGLVAGPYSYTVSDAHDCSVTGSVNITQPPGLPFTITDSVADVLCYGGSTGFIQLTPSGGTSPYATPFWSDLATGFTRSNLAANSYFYIDSDNNGCIDTGTIVIIQPQAAFTVTQAVTNELCYGDSAGTITLTLGGGTTPYGTVYWRDGGVTGAGRTGLKAGNYSYYVSDANGCTDSATITITQNPPVVPTVASLDSITCFGLNNGSVVIGVTGGDNTYTYELDNSGASQTSNVFNGLTPGVHTVLVQDGNLCDSSVTFSIYEPPLLTDSILNTINDTCFGYCDGVILATASGGTPPYQFSIDGTNYFSSPSFTGLCPNPAYTVSVRDDKGCGNNVQDAITQPAAVVVAPLDSVSPSCNNGPNGSFAVIASGGAGGSYTYSADGGPYQASDTFLNQSVGAHTVTARDSNGCTGSYSITILNPPATSFYTSTIVEDSCYGGSTGSITINMTGTTTPYSYTWSAGTSTTSYLGSIPAGVYKVTATDGNGCLVYSADSVNTVTQPSQLGATYSMTPVTCFGDSNGCIVLTDTGGTAPYLNSWSNGAASASPPCTFAAGTYTDTITDNNACQYLENVTVTQPTPISIATDSIIPVACLGDSNGAISITATGGLPGYTYIWSNGAATSAPTGLKPGSYTVTVSDTHACTDTATIAVGEVSAMQVSASVTNVLCPPLSNGRITLVVSGGTPSYQYTWSNGATDSIVSGLPVGTDSVVVTDGRGCTFDSSFAIINDSAFFIKPDPDTATILQGDQIELAVAQYNQGAGLASNTRYNWTPSSGLSCSDCQAPNAAPVVTTQYSITGVSDSGCVSTTQIVVTVTPQHQIYVPNAFTPNNDGINDYWEAFGYKKAWIRCSAQVFDRWGEKIFDSSDINFQWDGKYHGSYVEPGDYVYLFKVVFVDDYSVTNKGSITVIR